MDLGTFQMKKIIVHEVPRRRASGESDSPELSEVESPLDASVRNFVTEKLKETLAYAFDVVVDGSTDSPVPGFITSLLDGTSADFVDLSQQMANHLYESQTGAMSEGLLSLVEGEVDGRGCTVILKLERERGTRFQSEVINGQRTFRLDNIEDLMLTDKTRVFKAALFFRPTDDGEIEGHVSDEQRGIHAGRGIARFFLRDFLGCDFKERPNVTTQRAWEASESFINTEVSDPERQTKYQLALMTEMSSAAPQFNPANFANSHLVGADRQKFLNHLGKENVPTTGFVKDTELINSYIKLMLIESKNGIKVLGSRQAFKDHVSVKKHDQETVVEIKDDIKRVGR